MDPSQSRKQSKDSEFSSAPKRSKEPLKTKLTRRRGDVSRTGSRNKRTSSSVSPINPPQPALEFLKKNLPIITIETSLKGKEEKQVENEEGSSVKSGVNIGNYQGKELKATAVAKADDDGDDDFSLNDILSEPEEEDELILPDTDIRDLERANGRRRSNLSTSMKSNSIGRVEDQVDSDVESESSWGDYEDFDNDGECDSDESSDFAQQVDDVLHEV